jgi:general secretion pathway protein K
MSARRQRGVAAITAILIVAVAATAASLMLAQQSAMLDQTMLVASRAQADVYSQAGLDWARGVLAQDARTSGTDSLAEGWAQPIVGMPIDRAVVAGNITDEQGKFNLNNVIDGTRRSEADIKLLRQLLTLVDLSPDLADAVVDWIDGDDDLTSSAGAESAYYLGLPRPYRAANTPMVQVDELYRVRGFDAKAVARLRPYVTAVRERTTINANTASDVVVAAALATSRTKATAILAERNAKPFTDKGAFVAAATRAGFIPVNDFDVKSTWFSVVIQVAQDDVQVASEALVKRDTAARGGVAIVWRRPRY